MEPVTTLQLLQLSSGLLWVIVPTAGFLSLVFGLALTAGNDQSE